jgi:hypothetical protein
MTHYLDYSSVNKYRPSKVLAVVVNSSTALESWWYDDGFDDPWWRGASGAGTNAGRPTKFRIVMSVTASAHSSHLTREKYAYNGLDINVGMWVSSIASPKALKIVKIESKSTTSVTCIIEDIDRYNTFRDPGGLGNAMFTVPGSGVVFELGDDGLPVLDPVVTSMTDMKIFDQIMARFRVFNPNTRMGFTKLNHGFYEGEMLKVTSLNGFERAQSSDLYPVGVVVDTGPGPHKFYITPTTKLITNLEGVPGTQGDLIYQDATVYGHLTTTPGASTKVVFLKVTDSKICRVIGTVAGPSTPNGNKMNINKVEVTFNTGSGTLSDIITDINVTTSDHGVTAGTSPAETVVTGGVSPAYSDVSSGAFAYTINGETFTIPQNTTSITYPGTTYPGVWDMIRDINEKTDITDVHAEEVSGALKLTNIAGGAITCANVTPTTSSLQYNTFLDATGISASNPAGTANRLKLERTDGGEIIINNISGTPLTDLGVHSVDNGEIGNVLVVEQGGTASVSTHVVANITARNALTGLTDGSTAFVQDDGNGEWALYIYVNSAWVRQADEDSAATDANTMSTTLLPFSSSNTTIGTVSATSRATLVTMEVVSAFDGAPTLTVGDSGDASRLVSNSDIDLSSTGVYIVTSAYTYAAETDIVAYYSAGGATSGSVKITVSYM